VSPWPSGSCGETAVPKGPQGQKRPADVIGNAVLIAKIATGEVGDDTPDDGKDKAAQALGGLPCGVER